MSGLRQQIGQICHEVAKQVGRERQHYWRTIDTAPKDGGFIAANAKSGEVWAAWHYDSEYWHARYGSRNATHWMPLPEPPHD